MLLVSAAACTASAQDGEATTTTNLTGNISAEPTVLYNNTVNLTEGNFTFAPENSTRSYQADNFTDIGALNATGLQYNVSLLQDANMTNVSVLEGIEGIRNNNITGEIWFLYINGELAEENFGMNPVVEGDNLNFWYTVEEDGEAAIENATYMVNITVSREEGMEPGQNLTELYNDTVNLTQGTFIFRPENSTRNYQVNNLTDLGALNATGLNFTASVMQNMTGNITGNITRNMTGNMTGNMNMTPEFMLQSIDGIRNNNTTGEMWFTYINGAPAEENFGMNNVTDGDNLSFWYTTEQNGAAAIENATYVANVTVSAEKLSDIIREAETQQNLSTFVSAVEAANLTQNLTEEGPYTVFAPSNEAFNELPEETLNQLMNDTEMLEGVLTYHVAEGRFTREVLASTDNITNIQGDVLEVNATKGNITIEDANVTQITPASNGVLCVIDRVLIPPDSGIPSEEKLTELYNDTVNLTQGTFMFRPENSTRNYQVNNLTDLGALNATGLNFTASVMQNMTGAQNRNMTGVQTGDVTQTQTANLTTGTQTANLTQTQTGTIAQTPQEIMTGDTTEDMTGNVTPQFMLQSIDGIRNNNTTGEMWFTYIDGMPANRSLGMNNVTNGTNISFWYTTRQNGEAEIDNATYVANITVAREEGMEPGENQTGENQTANQTIVQAAQNQTNLSTFVNVVQTANMTQTLNTGNYTVFAPSNEAFNKLPAATRSKLMNDTNLLREVLSYHTVSGQLTSKQLVSMNNVTTVGGSVLQINVTQNNIMVQNVNVTQITVVKNGTICVIDEVLIPPESEIGDNQTGGIPDVNQTAGNQTGIWHFFSIPFEANNTSVRYLLSGVNYTSLNYYNASSRRFENASRIEPLKAYWINVPNGTQFNASQQFASVEKKLVTVPPSLRVYPGWNALGSPVNVTVPAEVAFITLDNLNKSSNNSSFVKVVGPWVPGNNTTGYYQYVGYNGFNGTINENQLGADEFEVRPFEGYWVFVDQQDLYA